jgi:hypothetical protein
MFCSQCGEKIPEEANFCSQCGHPVPAFSRNSGQDTPERLVMEVNANLFRGWEGVGGKLIITSKKLHFKSHRFNLQTGETILLLEEITGIQKVNTSGLVPNGLLVKLKNGTSHQFVVNRRNQVYDTIMSLLDTNY